MTYGWALLVVLIAIAALAFFGLLNPSKFLPDKAELGVGLTVVGFSADTTKIILYVNNGLGKTLRNFQVNATLCNDGNGSLSAATTIVEGKTKGMSISCTGLTANDKFKTDFITNYTTRTMGNTLSHTKQGRLVALMQQDDCDGTATDADCWSTKSPSDLVWGPNPSTTGVSTDETLSNGKANTAILYGLSTTDYPAAKYCYELTEDCVPQGTWFLPSHKELEDGSMLEEFDDDDFYWSSTEGLSDPTVDAWELYAGYGMYDYQKDQLHYVRCLR